MPLTFSVAENADMIYVYGFCDSNSVHAVAEYQWLFWTVEYKPKECLLEFTRCCEIPVHFPAFALQPSMMLMEASMKKKALFRWYRAVHVRVREELQDVFVFPTRDFTSERQTVLLPAVAFSKISFKNSWIQIKGNFTKLTLHLYFKCIMYYAGLLFCSVYCQ